MNPHLDALKFARQALAQPAAVQISLFDPRVVIADELALEFTDALWVATSNRLLHAAAAEKLNRIDELLEQHSGERNSENWTVEALRRNPLWEQVRVLAADALVTLGWPNEPPPGQSGG